MTINSTQPQNPPVAPWTTQEMLPPTEGVHCASDVWSERQALLRLALAPARARLTRAEVDTALDVANGLLWLAELAGEQIGPLVEDGCKLEGLDTKHGVDAKRLTNELASWPRPQRAAFELWLGDLWRRGDDTALWDREIAWLIGAPSS